MTDDPLRLSWHPELLGQQLAGLRKRAGLSQSEVAKRMRRAGQTHWRQTTASRIERGVQSITVGELGELMPILGVPGGWSWGRTAIEGQEFMYPEAGTLRKLLDVEIALLKALDVIHELRAMHGDPYAPGRKERPGDGEHSEET